jgi:hypothetical protein
MPSRVSALFCAAFNRLTLNGYYDFPLRMSFCQIAESFGRVAQRVTSIDDGCDSSSFKKILQKN